VWEADRVAVKVSVVVPTYAPGDRIDGLVRSLEAQTLPTSEWEVIFVDDGSPDDTWKRLQRIRDSHDNVRIERIPNSGWPSRPRNVGLELARGEYVLFMDHDDELYPKALEAGYAFAARAGADVLNGKETRTDQAKWALDVYTANMDNAIDRTDIHPLIPTNPHKLFRRELLMEHGIRFPEGRRVLWEDVFFALDVAQHMKVVSVMADTPFYHWVRGQTTASSSYTKNREEYWRWVREIVVQTNEKLAAPHLREQWRLMLLHQYRSRVLAPLGPSVFQAPQKDFEFVRRTADEIINTHVPEELDAYLTPTQLGRAVLVRKGQWDLLEKLVAVDSGIAGISRATDVRWTDGVLRISAEARWATGDGTPLAIRRDGDRVVRDVPPEVADALPDAALDMTDTFEAARSRLGIRARDTGITWLLPGTQQYRVDDVDGRPELVVTATAELDPQTAAFGRALEERSWDVTARNELLGAINQRGLRTSTASRTSARRGHVYIAYKNMSGMLSLDVDQTNRSLAGSAPLDVAKARTTVEGSAGSRWPLGRRTYRVRLEVPFTGVSVGDDTVLTGSVVVGKDHARPARIVARTDGLWLEATFEQPAGRHPMTLRFAGRDIDAGVAATVGARGEVSLSRSRG
jgi:glycosyltransferase involved in cell wall biosynthesis